MRARVKVTEIQRPRRPPTHRRPAALVRPSRCDRSAWCSPRLQTSHAVRQLPPRSAPLRAAPRLYAQRWAGPCRARNNGQKLRPCYSSGPPAPLQSAPTIPQSRPCGPADLRAQPQCHRMAKRQCRRRPALTPPRRLERRLHERDHLCGRSRRGTWGDGGTPEWQARAAPPSSASTASDNRPA
jgi:hypothetical protein